MAKEIWLLSLNDMRSPKIEIMTGVCWAETEQELLDLLEKEAVPTYQDDRFMKSHRKGGPLEWYNVPMKGPSGFMYGEGPQKVKMPHVSELGS